MSTKFKAYAATAIGGPLTPFEFDPGPLRPEQVEVKVSHCGICHSDLSMIDNDWGMSEYPFVPGHEMVGTVVAAGERVKRVKIGERVGVGWFSGSCLACPQCLAGDHNFCTSIEQTIVGRHGGFADRVRCNWEWATPVPDALDPVKVGPMFCGGITVFNPIVQCNVQPTDRVGVIGIGGLGHIALQFLNNWGCEVVAFTSTAAKREEAIKLGAHHTVSSRDSAEMAKLAGSLDFILVTANVTLDWPVILNALKPRGRLHVVGAVLEPIPVAAFSLIGGQKSISGSPLGSPLTTSMMLDFCARHDIAPVIEKFPLSKVNEALDHLRAGEARYRIVLENDLQ